MRMVKAELIAETVAGLCVTANCVLPEDVKRRIELSAERETWPAACEILHKITENYTLAQQKQSPICQDTGVACVFVEIGEEVFIEGSLSAAVDEGVRRGYQTGFLRNSVVSDPLRRKNTGDNTPAMLYTDFTPGSSVKITVAPKGFGSENMSAVKMLKPSDGEQGIIDFILSAVETAGPNPCPPIVVGIGIGGTFDKCTLLAKKALLRSMDEYNPDPYYRELEIRLLELINKLGIGPQGFGGRTTALHAAIETMPTHIAGLPCAVNINCHVSRHASEVL